MPNMNWRVITLALIAVLVALLLISEPIVSRAQPAVDGTVVTKTYAVVSMVSNRLSFVTRKFSTAGRLDHYDRRTEALQDDTIATAVLRTMANAVREVAPAAKTELLEIELPASQGKESVASDELLAVARQALRNVVAGRAWDFIVLLGPRREFEEVHMLGPNWRVWVSMLIREHRGVFVHCEYPVILCEAIDFFLLLCPRRCGCWTRKLSMLWQRSPSMAIAVT